MIVAANSILAVIVIVIIIINRNSYRNRYRNCDSFSIRYGSRDRI